MSRIEIPVEAKLNVGDIDAELKQLTQKINAVGQSIAKANQVKFNPITKASIDDLKRMNAEFEKLKRTSQLGNDINRTGQGGKSFLDLDWNAIASNSIAREARRYGAFNKVLAGSGASFSASTPAPSPGGGGGGSGGGNRSGGSPWANAGRKVISSGLRGAGQVGGVADEAISAGAFGGVMAGVAGLIGGVVALGVGKLVSGIANKVGDAQQDSIGYDTLKRQLGDVNASFDVLRTAIHSAAGTFEATNEQARKMAGEFAQISGISGKGSESKLANEIAVSGGFARAYGIDLHQSNRFFAGEHLAGVTHDDRDSKRLAAYIAEGIAKSGSSAKADEVLQAIGAYTSQQTRLGLASANVGGYNAMLTSMLGAHVPGMDVAGAAATLARVNGAIQSGGNAGEAGQNFMYMAVRRQLGINPIMAAALRENGAFATGQQTFGPGSVMAQWAAANGVQIPSGAANSSATVLSMIQDRLHSTYANNPELRLDAMHNLFGIGYNQAAFLDGLKPAQMGDAMDRLKQAGIDTKNMDPNAVASLAQVALGNRETLNNSAQGIWSKLSPEEQERLHKSASGDDDTYRAELLKDYAKHGQGETEGEQTRKSITDLDNNMQNAASRMIQPLNVMRDTMLLAFGKSGNGVMTADEIHAQVLAKQHQNVDDQADARIKKAQDAANALTIGIRSSPDAQMEKMIKERTAHAKSEALEAEQDRMAGHAALAKQENDYQAARKATSDQGASPGSTSGTPDWIQNADSASPGAGGSTTFDPIGGNAGPSDAVIAQFRAKYGQMAAEIAQQTGNNPNEILAQLAVETRWGRSAAAGNNPFNIQKSKNWTGATIMRGDTHADGSAYQTLFKAYGGLTEAGSDYAATLKRMDPGAMNTGGDIDQFTGGLMAGKWAEDPAYAGKIKGAYAALNGTPVPDTGSSASAGGNSANSNQDQNHNVHITLWNQDGRQAAAPVSISTLYGAPSPHGT